MKIIIIQSIFLSQSQIYETNMKHKKIFLGLVENQSEFQTSFEIKTKEMDQEIQFFTWSTAEDYLENSNQVKLDILFVDIRLPKMDGIELIRILSEENPNLKTAALTVADSEETIFAALRAGALGYLLKSELSDLNHIVTTILTGGAMITPTIALRMIHAFRTPFEKPEFELTNREKQVLIEIASGLSIHQAGLRLEISDNTLNTHLKNVYRKLRVRNRVQLIERARKLGYIE
ncbi:DNA-binding response regulator [Leptospira bouyouniensis]|uniref:DNA-binding response regulator n=2 Tax=Leptospira bouyouniensis TaxID=2484911 RepID=A0A7I0HPN7_9LEPT|nr:DNA-binding response regulator [Leptospira bouyouniensis]TGL03534.1 DNA-binding response regulator [Leptospira bouyouniensis]TGM80464.1 DNA-binding response regulator [Leptospira bouyouniensis]